MGHLVLVSNLFVAHRREAALEPPNFPVAPGYHPANIVVALTPFDQETLDHFVFLERPDGVELRDAPSFAPEARYARGPRPMHHAGRARLRDDRRVLRLASGVPEEVVAGIGERDYSPATLQCRSGPTSWRCPVALVTDLDSALARSIRSSCRAKVPRLKARTRIRAIQAHPFGVRALSRRAPAVRARASRRREPRHAHAARRRGPRALTHPEAAAVLDAANALYNHMLRLLMQAFGRAGRRPLRSADCSTPRSR